MDAIAYLRVSTNGQDANNQAAECNRWAASRGLPLPLLFPETASTKTHWRKRELAQVLDRLLPGDTLIVAEVSRLARSTLEVLEILAETTRKGIAVHVVKSALVFDGSTTAKITLTILALAAELERDLIRARTKSALDTLKAQGKTLGRPVGTKRPGKLKAKGAEIERLIVAGVSHSAIARLLQVSRATVTRYVRFSQENSK